MSETTCIHKWDWKQYGACAMCESDNAAQRKLMGFTETLKPPVNIGEIIEQVRALKRHVEWNHTYGAGFNRGIEAVIEILERHL